MEKIERNADAGAVFSAVEDTRRQEIAPVPPPAQTVPAPWMVLALFALIMTLNARIGAWAQGRNILWGLILTEWGLILLPVLGLIGCTRANLRVTLRLRRFSCLQGAGAGVMAVSLFTLVIGYCVLQEHLLPVSDPASKQEAFTRLFQVGNSWPGLMALLFVMALSPAFCEEALFRGALLSSLGQRMRPACAILAVALLFGLFHGSIAGFAPTAILGLGVTYVSWRGNSLWIGVIMHLVSNSVSALWHTGKLPGMVAQCLLSAHFGNGPVAGAITLAVAFAGCILGLFLIEMGTRGSVET